MPLLKDIFWAFSVILFKLIDFLMLKIFLFLVEVEISSVVNNLEIFESINFKRFLKI
jgi:hypothetical protein